MQSYQMVAFSMTSSNP